MLQSVKQRRGRGHDELRPRSAAGDARTTTTLSVAVAAAREENDTTNKYERRRPRLQLRSSTSQRKQWRVLRILCLVGLLLLILWGILGGLQCAERLGHVVDTILWRCLETLGMLPSQELAAATTKVTTTRWPSLEMRNRQTVHNFTNAYLEAVLLANQSSNVSAPLRDSAWQLPSSLLPPYPPSALRIELVVKDEPQQYNKGSWAATNSVQARLRRSGCHATGLWWCRRCLAFPLKGSIARCESLCPECYVKSLTTTDSRTLDRTTLNTEWQATGNASNQGPLPNHDGRIPRIIHHVGSFEQSTPTMRSHPDWIRTQNGWRSQGDYEYHAYTSLSQQQAWITRHYPRVFVHAFMFLSGSGQRQRELFSLLILYRKGGIVAHLDVLLEVKLESVFSVPDLSFVAAIDTRSPAPYQCLYSGLLAATAGHVWIGQAIEILMYQVAVESTGLLLDPWEETLSLLSLHFDVKSLELWRLWTYSCITGYPLGLVAHQLFGHSSPFQSLHPGLVKVTAHSNALFLLMSERDVGATRISDVTRNIVVASTNLIGWTELPMNQRHGTSGSHLREGVSSIRSGFTQGIDPIAFSLPSK